jgi:hypothetical protein
MERAPPRGRRVRSTSWQKSPRRRRTQLQLGGRRVLGAHRQLQGAERTLPRTERTLQEAERTPWEAQRTPGRTERTLREWEGMLCEAERSRVSPHPSKLKLPRRPPAYPWPLRQKRLRQPQTPRPRAAHASAQPTAQTPEHTRLAPLPPLFVPDSTSAALPGSGMRRRHSRGWPKQSPSDRRVRAPRARRVTWETRATDGAAIPVRRHICGAAA